jgi:small subunit ribosomal protein S17
MSQARNKKIRMGEVVSNKMDKTILVKVERRFQHPVYGKYIRRTKKFMAHDPENSCQIGDKVRIVESRPLSRRKRWRLLEIVERSKMV